MIVAMVVLGVWALVTVPMALVLLLDDDVRRPAHPATPIITIGHRSDAGPHNHRPAA